VPGPLSLLFTTREAYIRPKERGKERRKKKKRKEREGKEKMKSVSPTLLLASCFSPAPSSISMQPRGEKRGRKKKKKGKNGGQRFRSCYQKKETGRGKKRKGEDSADSRPDLAVLKLKDGAKIPTSTLTKAGGKGRKGERKIREEERGGSGKAASPTTSSLSRPMPLSTRAIRGGKRKGEKRKRLRLSQ